MAVNESFLPVGVSGERLDTAELTNSQGIKVHREMVVNASPTDFDARQEVDPIPEAARVILYDADGNYALEVKNNDEVLTNILNEMRLLNARFEEAFRTAIKRKDLGDGKN